MEAKKTSGKQVQIRICEMVDSPIWGSIQNANKILAKISRAFRSGHRVDLSFSGAEVIIPVFLNAAIGRLYEKGFSEAFVRKHLTLSDVSDDQRTMVDESLDDVKRYLANREGYDRAWKEYAAEYE